MAHRGSSADSLPVVVGRVGPPVGLGLDISQDHVLNRNGQTWHLRGRRGRRGERGEGRERKEGREEGRRERDLTLPAHDMSLMQVMKLGV